MNSGVLCGDESVDECSPWLLLRSYEPAGRQRYVDPAYSAAWRTVTGLRPRDKSLGRLVASGRSRWTFAALRHLLGRYLPLLGRAPDLAGRPSGLLHDLPRRSLRSHCAHTKYSARR